MKAQIHTNSFGDITLYVKGNLTFENNELLRKELEMIIEENPHSQITIDMANLDFVGASGISIFVDTLKFLNKNKQKIKLSSVRSEFIQVFKLYELDALGSFIEQFDNDDTKNLNRTFGNRSRTFEN